MQHLAVVAAVLGIAGAVMALLLPLTARRNQAAMAERDEALAAEAAIWS